MGGTRFENSYKIKSAQVKLLANRVITDSGCWEWTRSCDKDGYGKTFYLGVDWRVHRLSLKLFKPDEYKEYLMVLHKCDNPKCFNPEHLFSGTNSDNTKDAVAKGRNFEASKTHCPKGHEYTPDNYYTSSGGRQCKICSLARSAMQSLTSSI